MKLYLFRHGETDWNKQGLIQGQTDIALNSEGIRQAQELAEYFFSQGIKVNKVYTSPHKRAKDTAVIVAQRLGVESIEKDGFREMGFGLWEGMTWPQVRADYVQDYQKWYENRRYQAPPQGESYQELLVRVVKALREVIADNKEDVAVIAHSAVIMTLQSWLHDTAFDEMVKRYKTKNADGIIIDSKIILSKATKE